MGVIKTVTAKMLAISALCVSLLVKISLKMNNRIKQHLPKSKDKWLQTKSLNIKNDLRNHQEKIYAKIQEILLDKIKQNSLLIAKQKWGNLNVRVNNPS